MEKSLKIIAKDLLGQAIESVWIGPGEDGGGILFRESVVSFYNGFRVLLGPYGAEDLVDISADLLRMEKMNRIDGFEVLGAIVKAVVVSPVIYSFGFVIETTSGDIGVLCSDIKSAFQALPHVYDLDFVADDECVILR